ncbi:GDP-mannose 4,6-dehydratase [bacterium]|nr:GDP-mannose 4,6-dehydratase [bacterium]
MKKILITGGAGFIGSNFASYLYKKYPDYKIIILDTLTYAGDIENFPLDINNTIDSRLHFWYGNITNGELVDTLVSKADIVVHFAAETHVTRSIYDNLLFFETDIIGTQTIANSILKHKDQIERFIHISTSEVYGTALTEKMKEDHPLRPASPYASAKAGADLMVSSYVNTYNIPAIIIRPFNNYGYYQHLEKVVPRFITSCILDEPLTVHGDGKSSRDWLFIEDHCAFLDAVLHHDINEIKGEVFNVGSGRDISIKEIAELVVDKMGKPKSLIKYIGDRPGQVFRHTADVSKAKKYFNWEALTPFSHGLDKTIDWYIKNKKWWKKKLWMRHIPIISSTGKMEMH